MGDDVMQAPSYKQALTSTYTLDWTPADNRNTRAPLVLPACCVAWLCCWVGRAGVSIDRISHSFIIIASFK